MPSGPAPPEDGRLLVPAAPAHVVARDAPAGDERRDRVGVAEGVGLEVDRHVLGLQPQLLLHEAAGVEQVARDRLARGEVLVPLHPLAGRDLPAPLGHARLDPLEEGRVVPPCDLVDRGLALREAEVGELVHQPQDGGEGVVGDGDRLRPRPHPVHVDVGVADVVDGVGLRHRPHRGEDGLGLGDPLRVDLAAPHERPRVLDERPPLGSPVRVKGRQPLGESELRAEALGQAVGRERRERLAPGSRAPGGHHEGRHQDHGPTTLPHGAAEHGHLPRGRSLRSGVAGRQ